MASVWDKLWKVGLALWVVAAVCLLLAFRLFSIPSASMVPTVLGDNRDNSTDGRAPRDQGGVGLVLVKVSSAAPR